jgi:hypothetical protein
LLPPKAKGRFAHAAAVCSDIPPQIPCKSGSY